MLLNGNIHIVENTFNGHYGLTNQFKMLIYYS